MTKTITLTTPIMIGQEECSEVVLREATAGDVIEAQEESERVVMTPDGPALVSSPTLVGLGVLRRQVVSIGSKAGPADTAWLKRLTVTDLGRLQAEADAMDALATASVGKDLADRGRADGSGGND